MIFGEDAWSDSAVFESTGRKIYVPRDIIGLSEYGVYVGSDHRLDCEHELNDAERLELASHMIAAWTQWLQDGLSPENAIDAPRQCGNLE